MSSGVYDHLVADYLCTLESGFQLEMPGEEGWLITPFERPDGDYIELQLSSEDDGRVTISDCGDTTNFLFASGLDVDSQSLRDSLSTIASSYSVDITENEICLSVSQDRLGEGLHRLLNAIQTVNQLACALQVYAG